MARLCASLCIGLVPLALGCDGVEADLLSLREQPDLREPDLSPPPRPDASVLTCTTEKAYSMACETVLTWKLKAEMTCKTSGRMLGRLEVSDFCRMPPDGATTAVFDCCPMLPTATCASRTQGDGTTCKDADAWLLSAQLDCRGQGTRTADVVFADPCGASATRFRRIKYQCCVPTGPGPAGGRTPAGSTEVPDAPGTRGAEVRTRRAG